MADFGDRFFFLFEIESMNSLVKCVRVFARVFTPVRRAPGYGEKRLAAARGMLEDASATTAISDFHSSACQWQYNFMGSDLRRLPRLLIVQPRVLPRSLLKAKLMEAMRLVDSLEELRGADAAKNKRRQSPFVLVQSPRSNKRVHAGTKLWLLFS